ncbi:AzlD domain-containing protein [Sinomonas sp. ASV322]|uniref:branched-chain amino acid transporter permease n=1 Tax=Sinomonas sp. ASV322 TaxID=3041920 RepID=UPI0027DB63CD|nr:AzlD domain-containing protein [Sinomonas sp. ASV322]MDQ4502626.1 AzlD domain-containing protein [Sinomonas sp. ASV322]
MPDAGYIAAALAIGVAITVALRAIPFGMKALVRESALLHDLGRWMPLGAVTILAVYGLATIDFAGGQHGVPEGAGVMVTIAFHVWRRNAVLSIAAGTAVCLVLANLAL